MWTTKVLCVYYKTAVLSGRNASIVSGLMQGSFAMVLVALTTAPLFILSWLGVRSFLGGKVAFLTYKAVTRILLTLSIP